MPRVRFMIFKKKEEEEEEEEDDYSEFLKTLTGWHSAIKVHMYNNVMKIGILHVLI